MRPSPARTIVVGDVHGCWDELQALVEAVRFQPTEDRLIFVGDLINKGPASYEVLEYARSVNAEMVLGNHELKFLEVLEGKKQSSPQLEALKERLGSRLTEASNWIKSWPKYIETPEFLVVHGGLVPGQHPRDTPAEILANLRTWDGRGETLYRPGDPPWTHFYRGEKLIIYGHWAARGVQIAEHTIGLDSGCVYGGHLTAVTLPGRIITQVRAKKPYAKIIPI